MSAINGKIYKITNLINGKVYIGQTIVALNKRWKQHCNDKRAGRVSLIGQSIKRHGKENFTIEIVDLSDTYEDLNKKEIEYIKKFNSLSPSGYNLREGGNQAGFSDRARAKMSLSQKKLAKKRLHPRSKTVICVNTGKTWKNAKIAAKDTGINYSTLRSKLQGINANDTSLRYLKSKDNFKTPTGYAGGKNSQAKAVLCRNTGRVWDCAKDAAKELGLNPSTLRGKLNGNSKNHTSLVYKVG